MCLWECRNIGSLKEGKLELLFRHLHLQNILGRFHGLKLHDLRHTHATMLVSSGLNIKAVSSRLGHASVGITLDLYSHAQREDDEKAAKIMGDLMARKTGEDEKPATRKVL